MVVCAPLPHILALRIPTVQYSGTVVQYSRMRTDFNPRFKTCLDCVTPVIPTEHNALQLRADEEVLLISMNGVVAPESCDKLAVHTMLVCGSVLRAIAESILHSSRLSDLRGDQISGKLETGLGKQGLGSVR